MKLQYESNASVCNEIAFESLTQVSNFDSESGQLLTQDIWAYQSTCAIYIPYQPKQFWVISSDSLHISDTLRVHAISFQKDKDRCCDCPTPIKDVEASVHGTTYNEYIMTRNY